jgi:hypothetical protein
LLLIRNKEKAMKLLTAMKDGDTPVEWWVSENKRGMITHRIIYGLQSKSFKGRDIAAAEEFGYCCRHSFECAGHVMDADNR